MKAEPEKKAGKAFFTSLWKCTPLLIILSFFLLFIAIMIRYDSPRVLYDMSTRGFVAGNLLSDSPDVKSTVYNLILSAFPICLNWYVLPNYAFLLPAIIFLSVTLIRKGIDLSSFLERNEKHLLIFIMLINMIGGYFLLKTVTCDYPTISDEYSYFFQADLLSHGRLYAESPPMYESFSCAGVVNDGRWYSKYTIGWPLLLALGLILRVPNLINPLCASFSLLFIYLIVRYLWGRSGGFLTLLMVLMSPFFLLSQATYFPHTSSGLFTLIYIYSLIRLNDHHKYWIAGGISAGFIMFIRPVDCFLIVTGTVPLMIYIYQKALNRFEFLRRLVKIVLILLLTCGLVMLVNGIQTGNPLQFAFLKSAPWERWGFSAFEHTPLKGLWNVSYAFIRTIFWATPFIFSVGLLSFLNPDKRGALTVIPFILFNIFYAGYYALGVLEIGSRFYYPAILLLFIFFASGLSYLTGIFEKNSIRVQDSIHTAIMICMALFMALGVYPALINQVHGRYDEKELFLNRRNETANAGKEKKTIFFLRKNLVDTNTILTRNRFDYQNQNALYLLYLTPQANERVVRFFPDRDCRTIDFKPDREMQITELDNRISAENFVCASINHIHSYNFEKCEESALNALKLQSDNEQALQILTSIYANYPNKDMDKAVKVLTRLSEINPRRDSYRYSLARCYGEKGEYEKAIQLMDQIYNKTKDAHMERQSKIWKDHYIRIYGKG